MSLSKELIDLIVMQHSLTYAKNKQEANTELHLLLLYFCNIELIFLKDKIVFISQAIFRRSSE